jgi:anti-anti-sigma factor
MIYTYTTSDDGLVCKPWGNLDFSSSFALRHVVHDALDRQTRVLIDLSRVESIEAVGLSAIIGCLRRGRTLGAIVQVANVSPQVRRRIDMMGATRAFADTFGLSEIGSRSTSDRHGNTIPRMSGAVRPASVVQRRVSLEAPARSQASTQDRGRGDGYSPRPSALVAHGGLCLHDFLSRLLNPPQDGVVATFTRGLKGLGAHRGPRLSPGHDDAATTRPVLTAEATPRVDTSSWTLTVEGLAASPSTWTWAQIDTLPGSPCEGHISDRPAHFPPADPAHSLTAPGRCHGWWQHRQLAGVVEAGSHLQFGPFLGLPRLVDIGRR